MLEIILFVLAITGSFIWLLYETDLLTIRLPYGKPPMGINGLIKSIIGVMVFSIIDKAVAEILGEKSDV